MRHNGLLLVGALLSGGCATALTLRELNTYVLKNEFGPAVERVEKSKEGYGDKNALLYHLDRALLLQLAGRYPDSIQSFEAAKVTARDLYTKSVTARASTFLINDAMTPYYGEDFERALIHVFSAINYALLDQAEGALVECRQLDQFFRAQRFESGTRDAYRDDAFGRYLAGLLYESQGETNDAYISYFKALEGYDVYQKLYQTPRPPDLVDDALRTARRMGFSDKVVEIKKRWGEASPPPRPADTGEMVVLHYAGLGPEKVDSFFEISVYNGWPYVQQVDTQSQDDTQIEQAQAVMRSLAADKMIRVAFPKYRRKTSQISTLAVEGSSRTWRGSVVQDVGAIAIRNLEDRVGRTRGRAIARATIKFLLAQKVGKAVEEKNDEGLGFLVKALLQAAAAATEVADKRAWRTLPDRVEMVRVSLPEGRHALTLNFLNAAGAPVETRKLPPLPVTRGRRTFLIVRSAL